MGVDTGGWFENKAQGASREQVQGRTTAAQRQSRKISVHTILTTKGLDSALVLHPHAAFNCSWSVSTLLSCALHIPLRWVWEGSYASSERARGREL